MNTRKELITALLDTLSRPGEWSASEYALTHVSSRSRFWLSRHRDCFNLRFGDGAQITFGFFERRKLLAAIDLVAVTKAMEALETKLDPPPQKKTTEANAEN
jgi:hypothetical protein